jgi:hypothetical protein
LLFIRVLQRDSRLKLVLAYWLNLAVRISPC